MVTNILGTYLAPHPPIIIDKIGRGQERKASKTIGAMEKLSRDIRLKSPSTIVIITPHGPLFNDAIAISGDERLKGSFKRFGFEDLAYEFQNNLDLVDKILEKTSKEDIVTFKIDENIADMYDVEDELDHGALVPLHFINKEYKEFKLVHITYGLLPPKDLYSFGKLIKDSLIDLDEDAVIIASGDLSHKLSEEGPYGYSPYGKEFDEKIIDIIKEKRLKDIITFDLELGERAGECGLRSLMIMAGSLDKYRIDPQVLSYEGPFGVGYATALIDILGESNEDVLSDIALEERSKMEAIRENESPYVRLARKSLEHFIRTGNYLEGVKDSHIRKGVFVTLKKEGMLRGCIGTISPSQKSVEREIIENAVSAGTKDNRFDKVVEDELQDIVYSVDLLSEPETINSIDRLDIENYGVIVSKGFRRGLLLPNLEGVDTVEDQVEIALSKAGINPGENYRIERFKVTRHH